MKLAPLLAATSLFATAANAGTLQDNSSPQIAVSNPAIATLNADGQTILTAQGQALWQCATNAVEDASLTGGASGELNEEGTLFYINNLSINSGSDLGITATYDPKKGSITFDSYFTMTAADSSRSENNANTLRMSFDTKARVLELQLPTPGGVSTSALTLQGEIIGRNYAHCARNLTP